MRLNEISIRNFRRLQHAEIKLDRTSFLIGQNNYGKSSAIRAIEIILSQELPSIDDFWVDDSGVRCDTIQLTAGFADIDPETANSRGFRGRVMGGSYRYRKTYRLKAGKPIVEVECLEYPYSIKQPFADAKCGADLVAAGLDSTLVSEAFGADLTKRFKSGWERDGLDLVAGFDTAADPSWVANPGGIQGNVISRLPRILHVPPITNQGDVAEGDKRTLVAEVLGILFEDLLVDNPLATSLRDGLRSLEAQMSPDSDGSLVSGLCAQVNRIIGGVFPGCGIKIHPSLNDLTAVLKPRYSIELFSNTATGADRQGTGLLRTAIFSMLRYHSQLKASRDPNLRPLLIAFEEPELYLHPSAANLLRDTIYSLGDSDQIVCTTHSPWMIDLSKPLQSLTKMVLCANGSVRAVSYGVAAELVNLHEDHRRRVKMLQVFDDELSRVFFAERIIVVEGDTEEIVYKATLAHMDEDRRKVALSRVEVVKARGKASIIALVHYLKALGLQPFVIHDRDAGVAGAELFNPLIAEAVGNPEDLAVLEECIENALGYKAPTKEKPYRAYQCVSGWTQLSDVPPAWRSVFERALGSVVAPSAAQYAAPSGPQEAEPAVAPGA